MVLSYRDKETEQFSQGHRVKSFENIAQVGRRKLNKLEDATSLLDMANLPGNRFESLKGDRAGQYSIRINDQWRICFRWDDDVKGFFDVEIVDYH